MDTFFAVGWVLEQPRLKVSCRFMSVIGEERQGRFQAGSEKRAVSDNVGIGAC